MSVGFVADDTALLHKLNKGSWEKSFSPDTDVDWQETTTPAELRALHDNWSLLLGTRHEFALDDVGKQRYAAYQQMNLMRFTGIFERIGLPNFQGLYGDDADAAYHEYVSHLIKEETYHYVLFERAIARLRANDPALLAVPFRHLDIYISLVMFMLRCIPFRRLRHAMTFFFLRFAEEITLQANTVARRAVPRTASLIPRVWELHALDEARHVAFDDLMMRKAGGQKLARALSIPLCVGASILLNGTDVWAARRLGVKVGYLETLSLMKKTASPFKRRVFKLLFADQSGEQSGGQMDKPFLAEGMTSVETYMYGLKARAHKHHCLVHGTFPVELTKLGALRKTYSKQVRPVTLLPFWVKAVALSVRATPGVNRILFKKFPWGRRIARFNVVDVNLPITRKMGNDWITFIGTIRGADKKTVGEIQDELEKLQRGPPEESPYIQRLLKLKSGPPFAAKIFHWLMTWSPTFYLKNAGTCSLTTLDGMRGDHFFSTGPTTSLFCMGGMGDEAVVRDGQVVVRRMLKCVLALDNYVVMGLDGVVLARTFQGLLESGSFVEDELKALQSIVAVPEKKAEAAE